MARKNSRTIGKVAELQAAAKFNRLFMTNFRRAQQHKGAVDSADLIDDDLPYLCPESKRVAGFSTALHNAVDKARHEATPANSAFVLHRCPKRRWLLTVDLADAPELVVRLASLLAEWGGCDRCDGTGWVAAGNIPDVKCDICDGTGTDPNGKVAEFLKAAGTAARERKAVAEAEGIDGNALKRKAAKK